MSVNDLIKNADLTESQRARLIDLAKQFEEMREEYKNLPVNDTTYVVNLYASADVGIDSPLKQVIDLTKLVGASYSPGAWNTPFYILPDEGTDTEFLELALTDYGFFWGKLHRSFVVR